MNGTRAARALVILALVTGCAKTPALATLDIPVPPLPPARAVRPHTGNLADLATERVLTDTAATQARAACFVARPSTDTRAIDNTARLAMASDLATARLRAHRIAKGAAPAADVRAARKAADALARQIPDDKACPRLPDAAP